MEKSQSGKPYVFIVVSVATVLVSRCLLMLSGNMIIGQLASLIAFFGSEALIVLAGFFMAFEGDAIFKWTYLKSKLWLILAYFLVLIANIIFTDCADSWKYFFMVQRITTPAPLCFPESWIVPVIIFGLIIFVVLKRTMKRFFKIIPEDHIDFICLLTLIVAVAILRAEYFVYGFSIGQWDERIHLSTFCRLDALHIGILAAFLSRRNFFANRSVRLMAGLACIFGIIFFSIGVGYLQITTTGYPFFWNVLYLPLVSVTITLLIVSTGNLAFTSNQKLKVIAGIAACSYLIYYLAETILLSTLKIQSNFLNTVVYILLLILTSTIFYFVMKRIENIHKDV